MDIIELQQLLQIANINKIEQKLRQQGYTDMSKDPALKHTSLVDIVQKGYAKAHTELECGAIAFTGSVYINVPTLQGYEVLWVEYLKAKRGNKMRLPTALLLYAKKCAD